MNRRSFVKSSSILSAGLFSGMPLWGYGNNAFNPLLGKIAKELFKELLIGIIIEVGKELIFNSTWNDFEERKPVNRTMRYLEQKEYIAIPNIPVFGYNYDNPISSQELFSFDTPYKKDSGFDGMMAFTMVKNNSNGDVINTQTGFVIDTPKRKGTAAILSEIELIVLLNFAKKLIPYYPIVDLQKTILPVLNRNKKSLPNIGFNSSSYETKAGKIIIDAKTEYELGNNNIPTKIEGKVFLQPDRIEKKSKSLVNKIVTENFKIDIPDFLESISG